MPTPSSSSRVNSINKTGDNRIDPLLFGQRWASQSISYSFPSQNSAWSTDSASGYGPRNAGGEPWHPSFQPLSEVDRSYFELALQQWANVANVHFNLLTESSDSVGDIRVAYSETAGMADAEAWSYLPTGIAASGDIWINSTSDSAKVEWIPGDYAFLTVLQEIGHSLGLEHPFDDSSFPATLDSMSTTIMSYSALPGDQIHSVRARYRFDTETEFENVLTIVPRERRIHDEPALDVCMRSGRVVPVTCLEKCAISGDKVLRNFLVQSAQSGRRALP